ncbi:filaggrin-2-like isoform X1 [Diabrotica virgifera virgifera]|uniref:Filaggrin-2-like n=1 Tax=Diabrotica virgifera virgifera TaxID=50390 RepID=A0ABM5JWP9_DIAVI|nr:filaggrin-2-like isoform X1 [Diabrotica virgifera virgifera]
MCWNKKGISITCTVSIRSDEAIPSIVKLIIYCIFLLVFSSSGILAHPYGASTGQTKGGLNLGMGLELEGNGHDANSQNKGLPGVGAHVKANVDIAGVHLGYDEGVDLGGSKGIALTKQVDVAGHKVGVEQNEINLGQKKGQGLKGPGEGHIGTLQGDLSGKTEVHGATNSNQDVLTKTVNGIFGINKQDSQRTDANIQTGYTHNTNQDGALTKTVNGIFGVTKQGSQRGESNIQTGYTHNTNQDGLLTKTVNGIFGLNKQDSQTGGASINKNTEGKATSIDTNQANTHSYGLGSYGGSSGTTRGNSNGNTLDISQQHTSFGKQTQGGGSYSGSSSHSWSTSESRHSHTSGGSKGSSLNFGGRPFFDDHSAESSEMVTSGGSHSITHNHGHDHSHASGSSRGNVVHFGGRPFFDDHSAESSERITSGSSHSTKVITHDHGHDHHSHGSGSSRGNVVHFGGRPFFDDHSADSSEVITSGGSHSTRGNTRIHDQHRSSGNSRGGSVHFGNRTFYDDHSAESSEEIGYGSSHSSNNQRHGTSSYGFNSGVSGKHEAGGSYGTGHSSGGYGHGGYGSGHPSSGEYVHRITDGINVNGHHSGHGSGHSSVVESGHTGGIGLGLAGSHRSTGSHESGGGYSHGIGLGIGIGSNHRGSSGETGLHGHGVDGHLVVGGYGTGSSDRETGAGLGLGIGVKGGHNTNSGYGHSSYSG